MKRRIDHSLSWILVILMVIMVLSVSWQVFSRYILNDPSSFTEELARYLMIWVGVLGAAYASGQRAHLAITILPEKLSLEKRAKLNVLINLLVILFAFAAFLIGGGRLVYITYVLGQNSASLKLPLFLVYAIIPLSGALIILYKVLEIPQFKKEKV